MRIFGGFLAVLALAILGGCQPDIPPHVLKVGDSQYAPAMGYTWVNPDNNGDLNVKWTPGFESTDPPHLIAGQEEGKWFPDDGYRWDSPKDENDLKIVWSPGTPHSVLRHVVADEKEGYWHTEPGYTFSDPNKLSAAIWTEGLSNPDYPHITSSSTEGDWLPDAGYTFSRPGDATTAVWTPGTPSPTALNVVADDTPDHWRPAPGYQFVNNDQGDFSVIPVVPEDNSDSSENRVGDFLAKLFVAAVANHYAQSQDGDGFFARNVVRPAAADMRDAALNSASQDLK